MWKRENVLVVRQEDQGGLFGDIFQNSFLTFSRIKVCWEFGMFSIFFLCF